MNKTLYVTKEGTLKRKTNTLLVETPDGPPVFAPVEAIEDINLMGGAEMSTGLLELLNQKGIVLHVFNHYGSHIATVYPDQTSNGLVLITQAAFWLDEARRHALAVSFVTGAIANMRRVASYYQYQNSLDVSDILDDLSRFEEQARQTKDVPELLGVEGSARNAYYRLFDRLIQDEAFKLGKRVRQPPDNPMNALISFLNCVCYSMTLSQLHQTRLDPRIGFLHSPSNRHPSLNLDLAEIFKPLLVDRLIFTLVNKRMVKAEDFVRLEDGTILMTKEARRLVAQTWDDRLCKTIVDPATGKRTSWRHLVLIEAQKLQRHILEGADYEPFRYRW